MATPTCEKQVMVVGIDDSEPSIYALEWTLDHFFAPFASNPPFNLFIVHAKPPASSAVGLAGAGMCIYLTYICSSFCISFN